MRVNSLYALDDVDPPEGEIPKKNRALAVVVGLFFIAVIAGLAIWWTQSDKVGIHDQGIRAENARSTYLNALSEPDTGRRLARFDDFLNQFPNAPQRDAARAARDVLRQHEQAAWADYTKARYDLNLDQDGKSKALSTYIRTWGLIVRQSEITEMQNEVNDEYVLSFANAPSRFAGNQETIMVGGERYTPVRYAPPSPRKINQVQTQTPRPAHMMKLRTDKAPTYPNKARRRGVEATVVLALDIDDKGRVRRTHVVSVDAPRYGKNFASAAKYAARRTRYYPKLENGQPVAVPGYQRTYRFKINP